MHQQTLDRFPVLLLLRLVHGLGDLRTLCRRLVLDLDLDP
jgi:hypothetical protein